MGMHVVKTLSLMGMVTPRGEDLWAFYVLTFLWAFMFVSAWLLTRWLRNPAPEEGHRGL